MDGQKARILSDLKVISELQPGKTLSIKDMSVVNPSNWSTYFNRRWNRESPDKTITHIKEIFDQALEVFRVDPSQDLFESFEPALKGFENLRATYVGKYYVIGDINRIVEQTRTRLKEIITHEHVQVPLEIPIEIPIEIPVEDPTVEELEVAIQSEIINEMNNEVDDQKIYPRENNEAEQSHLSLRSPSIQQVVETSDRTSCKESVTSSFDKCSSSGDRENSVSSVIPLIDDIGNLVCKASDDTLKVVLSSSDEVSKNLGHVSNSSHLSKSQENGQKNHHPSNVINLDEIISDNDSSEKIIKNIDTAKGTGRYVTSELFSIKASIDVSNTGANNSTSRPMSRTAKIVINTAEPSESSDTPVTCPCLEFNKRGRRVHRRDNTTNVSIHKCPAFNSKRTIENIEGPPPIVRIARALQCWIESFGADTEYSEDELSSSGTLKL